MIFPSHVVVRCHDDSCDAELKHLLDPDTRLKIFPPSVFPTLQPNPMHALMMHHQLAGLQVSAYSHQHTQLPFMPQA